MKSQSTLAAEAAAWKGLDMAFRGTVHTANGVVNLYDAGVERKNMMKDKFTSGTERVIQSKGS
jgi:hypothetical protein